MAASISVVIHTLDEERNIRACIETVAWADEIVVVDMESSDRTVEIARELGAKVVSHPKAGYAEPARNFGIAQTSSEWVFAVDADERVPPALAQKLRELAEEGEYDLVEIPSKNLWLGRWVQHGGHWPNEHGRFFRKGTVAWSEQVHGAAKGTGRTLALPAQEDLALEHHWQESVGDFLTRMSRYSGPEADLIAQSRHPFRRRHVLVHPARAFWTAFVRDQGYRDGFDGLVLAFLSAVYRLFALLRHWERQEPRDYGDRGLGLVRFLLGVLFDTKPRERRIP